jgi:hypothetical protein
LSIELFARQITSAPELSTATVEFIAIKTPEPQGFFQVFFKVGGTWKTLIAIKKPCGINHLPTGWLLSSQQTINNVAI